MIDATAAKRRCTFMMAVGLKDQYVLPSYRAAVDAIKLTVEVDKMRSASEAKNGANAEQQAILAIVAQGSGTLETGVGFLEPYSGVVEDIRAEMDLR
jgi:hypothetical protein